jgi:hypothetical protein
MDSPDLSHMSLSALENGPPGSEIRGDRDFGGPANSESPVALRPPLAKGLPFRFNTEVYLFPAISQWIRSDCVISNQVATVSQPKCADREPLLHGTPRMMCARV